MPVPKGKRSDMADLPNPTSPELESGDENLLTCIHGRIHCVATHEGEEESDLDNLHIQNFLDTLAEVALAIASRGESTQEGKRDIAA